MISLLRTYGWAMASGLLMSWACPRFHLHPLAWVALVPLLVKTRDAGARESARQFAASGLVYYLILLQWLMANIHWAGGWAVLGYFLLCGFLSLYWAAVGAAWSAVRQRSARWGGPLLLACAWVSMEFAQERLLSGFGWGAFGYSQGGDLPMAQWAALGGVEVLSFFIVLVNAWAAKAWSEKRGRWAHLAGIVVLLAACHGLGWAWMGQADYTAKPFRAGIYQSNYSEAMKMDPDYYREMVDRACAWSLALTQNERVDCVVWPEALVLESFHHPNMLEPMRDLVTASGAPLLAGTAREDIKLEKEFNSSVLVDASGKVAGYYDKVHLAPFGEYIPFEDRWPALALLTGFGGIASGTEQRLFETGGRRLGPLICFEVLFPALSWNLRAQGADCLVVMTNLAWFGQSNIVSQELEIARLRAIEQRLPLIHSANTGVSGVFDPWGRFSPVDATLAGGQYQRFTDPDFALAFASFNRCMGALAVAAPAAHPFPWGPALFPWLAIALAILCVAAARFMKPAA